ncbi:MAG: helix-turn-helix transcriptional regulator [Actinomycetota bacterium]|nr:helix-turn-helix transcriptional regulator [Actinomycetota bacterium]
MSRRSYGQYCGLARALNVVGERWSLLIVRELLVRPARYTELVASLPGVATNLLAERLRALAAAGVVERRLDPASNGVIYALTPWGAQLREAVDALIRWSAPLMSPGPGADSFQPRWLVVALRALLHDRTTETPVTVGLDTAGTIVMVQLDETGPHVVPDPDPPPSTVLRADPEVVLGLAAGAVTVEHAIAGGTLRGDPQQLAAVFGTAKAGNARPRSLPG